MVKLPDGHRGFRLDYYRLFAIVDMDTDQVPAKTDTVGKESRNVRFGPKVGQISSKWYKSWIFSDQISLNFGSPSKNVLKCNTKKKYQI